MDYKEEYQKALERAKKGLPIDEVFPELKESEDERIRKELIEAIEKARVFDIDKEVADRWIAYLEKQKEQKPNIEIRPRAKSKSFTEVYMKGWNDAMASLKPAESTALHKAFISSKIDYALEEKCDASDYADTILPTSVTYGENDEEYKLHKIIEAAFIAGQKKEQQPAECWRPSIEQMAMLRAVINDKHNMASASANLALNSLYDDLIKL